MNQSSTDQAAELLKTIAHPIRLRIVLALAEQPSLNVSAMQKQLELDQSLLSHYLNKMRDRGVLTSKRQGKEMHYSLADTSLAQALLALLNSSVLKNK